MSTPPANSVNSTSSVNSVKVGAMYSVLCTKELLSKIVPIFNIPTPISCELLRQGYNDSYKVTTKSESYLLRIYNKGWRTKSDIEFELSVLNHLHLEQVKVSYPIETVTGEQIISITSPEGERFAILTSFAEGKSLSFDDASDVALFGKHMAKIHKHSENFNCDHDRFKIDLFHLIEEPLSNIKPYLKGRDSDWKFLNSFASSLLKNIENTQAETLDFGLCHGDLHYQNVHKLNGELTSFDFDCCGFGYRAFDLATFKFTGEDKKEEHWPTFMNAYSEIREISENDLALVDDFVSIRHIWLLGHQIHLPVVKGWLSDKFFTDQLKLLKDQCGERGIEI